MGCYMDEGRWRTAGEEEKEIKKSGLDQMNLRCLSGMWDALEAAGHIAVEGYSLLLPWTAPSVSEPPSWGSYSAGKHENTQWVLSPC